MADVPNSDPRVERRARRRSAARRRRLVAALVALAIVAAVAFAAFFRGSGDAQAVEAAVEPVARPAVVAKPKTPVADVEGRPSDKARLKLRAVISGNISPKSVVSSGAGYVTAQNMMYRHSVTVYDVRTLKLVKTISDAVNLRALGYPELSGDESWRPGRGGVLTRRPLRVRLELLDVRAALRVRGERQLHAVVRLPRQLRLPDRHGALEDRRGVQGRSGAQGRRRDPGRPLRPRLELVHMGPERHLHEEGARGEDGSRSARIRAGSRSRRRATPRTSR